MIRAYSLLWEMPKLRHYDNEDTIRAPVGPSKRLFNLALFLGTE